MNTKLFNDLYNAYEYFRICAAYEEIKERYQKDKTDCEAHYKKLKARKASPKYFNIYLSFMLILSVSSVFLSREFSYFSLVFPAVIVIIMALNTMLCKVISKKYKHDAEVFWNSKGKQICEEDKQYWYKAYTECNAFKTHNGRFILFLPQKYRNMSATHWMANAVANRRADSLKEVINLYEEQLHRWELESINREIASQNAQIEKRLSNIYHSLDASYAKLQNLEALEIYRILQHK